MQVLQVQLEVGADPAEVGRARRWARSRLVGSGIAADEPLAETLVLLISELVTNAVVHTGCPAVLRMLFPGDLGRAPQAGSGAAPGGPAGAFVGCTVRVEVADVSACPPRPRHAEGEDTNGRGLELVDGLADRWGWQAEGTGKRIWCEVDRQAVEPAGARAENPGNGLYEPSCAVTNLA
ncbi:ATP-binding protein [Streptomyces sp. NPDC004111]|uniref:ATP-binding protein n=1 Tax=Streptomyces sp. NPDC004111 TaxID=3364690 RepID=UPI00368CC680